MSKYNGTAYALAITNASGANRVQVTAAGWYEVTSDVDAYVQQGDVAVTATAPSGGVGSMVIWSKERPRLVHFAAGEYIAGRAITAGTGTVWVKEVPHGAQG